MNTLPPRIVVMGASAGALEALSVILSDLPADFALPIVIVVHLPPHRESVLAELLGARSRLKVREVEDKEPMQPGTAYVAPPDYHVLIEQDGSLSLSSEEEILFSRPSIDVLFETAADAFRERVVGVILTGANEDGARGLQAIAGAGGIAIAQDPTTASSAIMPASAIKRCPNAAVVELANIASHLKNIAI